MIASMQGLAHSRCGKNTIQSSWQFSD